MSSDIPPTARAVVNVSYHQMLIKAADEETYTEPPMGDSARLVVARKDAATIWADVHTGPVQVSVQIWDHPPERQSSGWDKVAEIELVTSTGLMRVMGFMDFPPDELPVLTPRGPGSYGVRVHTRRPNSARATGGTPSAMEEFLIVTWPVSADEGFSSAETQHGEASLSDQIRSWSSANNDPFGDRGRL
ncbi:hypothetical protein AB0K18_10540 [Nonomuraea sp. NPDC049421]|uniref:hypothetical protein n=1 Tax=Nonomuraea sp. NPDC049421 TaxID=3155275 RepID=UPI00341F0D9E